MELYQRIKRFLRPHSGMKKVRVHDNCGGWLFYVEYSCGVQIQCSKCNGRWEGYFRMGNQPKYHTEWKPKSEVAKFYGEN